jgi:uncharacterized membrane protein
MDQAELERLKNLLRESLEPNAKAQRERVELLAEARARELIENSAADERGRASAMFGWFLLFVSLLTIAAAVYMRVDGARTDSVVTLLLSTIPMVAGGFFIQRYQRSKQSMADALLATKKRTD